MRKFVLFTGLAVSCLAMSAQVATTELVGISSQNCPVAASAERGAPGAVVQTRGGNRSVLPDKLYLHFLPTEKHGITDIAITLHGTDARPRAEYAGSAQNGDLTEDFRLTSGSGHDLRSTSVNPKKVVNVRWIGITEIKFADGTSWHPTSDSYCHIQPNGFRLVTSGK